MSWMKWRCLLLVIFVCSYYGRTFAQKDFGVVPYLKSEVALSKSMTLDVKLQNRYFINDPNNTRGSLFDHSGVQIVATGEAGALQNFGSGLLVRYNNSSRAMIFRLIEEYSFYGEIAGISFKNRIRTDQTFQAEGKNKYRLRYRISRDQPLKGIDIDPNEYYLKINNEYVGSSEDGSDHLEVRWVSNVGYTIGTNEKIEVGVDYRESNLMEKNQNNRLWINIGWEYRF